MKKVLVLLFLFLSFTTVSLSSDSKPENIVMLICDGMGFNHLFISELVTGENMGDCNPTIGIGRNEAIDNLVTDSAAAATAMFSGIKTLTGYIGLNENGEAVDTFANILKDKGWWLGLITNTRYYDATPAGVYAHAHRKDKEKITDCLVKSSLDLFYAGGLEELGVNPFTQKPTPNSRIFELIDSGYRVLGINFKEIGSPEPDQIKGTVAFVTMGDKNFENDLFPNEPTLLEMVERAFKVYSQEDRNKLLIVEAGRIDDASHINDSEAVKTELAAFRDVLKFFLSNLNLEKDLLIVFADHETGGLCVPYGKPDGDFSMSWSSNDHTASYVPIIAYGAGSQSFSGFYHLKEIPGKICELLDAILCVEQ